MRTPFPVRITAACLLVTMAACTTWQPYQLDPDSELPRRMRVSLATGESVRLVSPSLEGETALVERVSIHDSSVVLYRVPLREVESIEREVFSPVRTFLVLVGTGAVIVGAALVALTLEYES